MVSFVGGVVLAVVDVIIFGGVVLAVVDVIIVSFSPLLMSLSLVVSSCVVGCIIVSFSPLLMSLSLVVSLCVLRCCSRTRRALVSSAHPFVFAILERIAPFVFGRALLEQ